MTAFEELKAWCEKYLDPDEYKIVPESDSYCASIYFDVWCNDNASCFVFNRIGKYTNACTVTNEEMCEHIRDYERKEESALEIVVDPPLTSIGGMMIRKMIAEYERKQHETESRG